MHFLFIYGAVLGVLSLIIYLYMVQRADDYIKYNVDYAAVHRATGRLVVLTRKYNVLTYCGQTQPGFVVQFDDKDISFLTVSQNKIEDSFEMLGEL